MKQRKYLWQRVRSYVSGKPGAISGISFWSRARSYVASKSRRIPGIFLLISLLATVLSGLLLFQSAVFGGALSFFIALGLDPLRSQCITALLVTMLAAALGGLLGRRIWMAAIGGGVVFWIDYLAPFIQAQQQPVYDPGGHLEPLNSGALVHTSFMLAALGILVAFAGAAVGVAFSQVLFDPFIALIKRSRANSTKLAIATNGEWQSLPGYARRANVISSWIGALVMIGLILLASGSSDLFIYSPDIGLHTPPALSIQHSDLPTQGTIVQGSLVSQALNGQRRSFEIYLPPSYNTPQGRTKRYPTLYLLHGSPGSDVDWFAAGKANESADTLIDLGKIPELIIVCPDGNGRSGASSEWGNSYDGNQRIETFVATDLVSYVDQHYRTISSASYRAIGGNSMGGFGAMNIAIHHPGVFGFVISLGGYYQADGAIWGNNPAYLRANSPMDTILVNKQAWSLRMFLGAATRDQPYYSDTLRFAREISKLHIQYHLDVENGYHAWKIWQVQIYKALLWLHWG